MDKITVQCPHCKRQIELTEAITKSIRDGVIGEWQPKIEKRQQDLDAREQSIKEKENIFQQTVANEVAIKTKSMDQEALKKARELVSNEQLQTQAKLDSQPQRLNVLREQQRKVLAEKEVLQD